jgi:hypothetical protein
MLEKPVTNVKELAQKIRWRMKLLPYLISSCTWCTGEFVIVTGADTTHYRSLYQLLSSLRIHEPDTRIIVFDLGLVDAERQDLNRSFPAAEVRIFDYSRYPDYFNIRVNAGQYAWKPVIICELLSELKYCVCWMDAGNIVTRRLFWVRKITGKIGMYSPRSSGSISDWTHPGTLRFLNVSNDLLQRHNLSGGCVSVCYKKTRARELVNRWKQCALTRDCIAPKGSSRKNHRQDQAVLSVIAHQSGITENMPTSLYGFKTHRDIH